MLNALKIPFKFQWPIYDNFGGPYSLEFPVLRRGRTDRAFPEISRTVLRLI